MQFLYVWGESSWKPVKQITQLSYGGKHQKWRKCQKTLNEVCDLGGK